MSRFYVGQPVVCIWSREQFLTIHETPIKGQKYHVSKVGTGYSYTRGDAVNYGGYQYGKPFEAVALREMDQLLPYREGGFAPITDNEVRAIIAEANRVSRKENA